ncbi:hypothetical protein ABEB36_012813 [Hypothenemus hampei]|uniref:THAP-type domain-containing protein n=1 Tax=Hypothenemus hampei TaxID=57062 RepID=A0ABD1E8K9_HYPHA
MARFCCVPKCRSSKKGENKFAMRTLPVKDLERFKIWVQRIDNPNLKYSEESVYLNQVYRTLRVCNRHFDRHCILVSEKQLMRDALPTLYLPNFHEESTEENSLYRHWKHKVDSEKKNCSHFEEAMSLPGPSHFEEVISLPGPSYSRDETQTPSCIGINIKFSAIKIKEIQYY